MFRHPRAGCQLVKGSIEPGESPAEAALRELYEESGIAGAHLVADLGFWAANEEHQVWSFHLCEPAEALPDFWSHHCADGGGHVFRFFWQPLAEDPRDCFPVFIRAVQVIRARLSARASSARP
jgi:8-oxo-dGTP pyrophosphatase MutT (NUDIX family)